MRWIIWTLTFKMKLSNQERARAIGMLQSGQSFRQVARYFQVSPTTISNLNQRYLATDEVRDRPRSGHPRATTKYFILTVVKHVH